MLAGLRVSLLLLTMFLIAEAVLVVERVDLPYLVVMADDSASMAREDQYDDPRPSRTRAEQLAAATDQPDASRFSLARGWLGRDDGALLRSLQRQHRVRLYLVSGSARELAEVDDAGGRAEPALEDLAEARPEGEQSRLGAGVRQVLTELRGAPPTAVVLLTDGQTTRGETLSEVAPLAARKGVPLFTVGVGDDQPPRDLALSDLVVDDVVFVGDVVRFRAKLSARGFEGRPVRLRLLEAPPDSGDEAATAGREVASRRGRGPARRPVRARRAGLPARGDRPIRLRRRRRRRCPARTRTRTTGSGGPSRSARTRSRSCSSTASRVTNIAT